MRNLLCLLGYHKWYSKIEDYIEEFGFVPLDNRITSNSKCIICGKQYKTK
jgi:hypothetical protein